MKNSVKLYSEGSESRKFLLFLPEKRKICESMTVSLEYGILYGRKNCYCIQTRASRRHAFVKGGVDEGYRYETVRRIKRMYYEQYETDIGTLTIGSDDGALTIVEFGALTPSGAVHERSRITDLAADEIREYLAGERREFDIPLKPEGTPFQKRVWQALLTIPYGETRSYKDIAIMAGSPKGFRAVGMANNRNPIAIIIPCHRVIGADGSMTGYGGGIDIKTKLLYLEKNGHS